MKNKTFEKLITNAQIQDALVSARNFCEFIDSVAVQKYTRDNFIDLLHVRLSDLYSKSILLPQIESVVTESKTGREMRETDTARYNKLTELLGEYTDYSQSFDPTILNDPENYTNGWLVDDLADIYNDLKEIIKNIETDTDGSVQHALWHLKFGFGAHWGSHLIDALRFVHYVKYQKLYRHIE